jgi:hypothetical protein
LSVIGCPCLRVAVRQGLSVVGYLRSNSYNNCLSNA